jgi:thiol-disulfide isomerase/thioredoxin
MSRQGRTISSRSQSLLLALVAILLTGCSAEPESSPPNQSVLVPMSMDEWTLQLGDYPPDILVVDFWASWCAPCIERFPRMVEMAAQYANQGVSFVSFNLDDPGDPIAMANVEDFLQAMEAPFDHFSLVGNVVEAMTYLGLQSIPAVSIYDRNGVEITRLTGEDPGELFDDEDVENALLATLAAQPRI